MKQLSGPIEEALFDQKAKDKLISSVEIWCIARASTCSFNITYTHACKIVKVALFVELIKSWQGLCCGRKM